MKAVNLASIKSSSTQLHHIHSFTSLPTTTKRRLILRKIQKETGNRMEESSPNPDNYKPTSSLGSSLTTSNPSKILVILLIVLMISNGRDKKMQKLNKPNSHLVQINSAQICSIATRKFSTIMKLNGL